MWLPCIALYSLALAAEPPVPPEAEHTPPRLASIDGAASWWRPGADDWSPGRVNTPLAAGDRLYTGAAANLEIQIGSRAFVRAAESTERAGWRSAGASRALRAACITTCASA
jgi:hypothetical protein